MQFEATSSPVSRFILPAQMPISIRGEGRQRSNRNSGCLDRVKTEWTGDDARVGANRRGRVRAAEAQRRRRRDERGRSSIGRPGRGGPAAVVWAESSERRRCSVRVPGAVRRNAAALVLSRRGLSGEGSAVLKPPTGGRESGADTAIGRSLGRPKRERVGDSHRRHAPDRLSRTASRGSAPSLPRHARRPTHHSSARHQASARRQFGAAARNDSLHDIKPRPPVRRSCS
jgi:hypothetical protein